MPRSKVGPTLDVIRKERSRDGGLAVTLARRVNDGRTVDHAVVTRSTSAKDRRYKLHTFATATEAAAFFDAIVEAGLGQWGKRADVVSELEETARAIVLTRQPYFGSATLPFLLALDRVRSGSVNKSYHAVADGTPHATACASLSAR